MRIFTTSHLHTLCTEMIRCVGVLVCVPLCSFSYLSVTTCNIKMLGKGPESEATHRYTQTHTHMYTQRHIYTHRLTFIDGHQSEPRHRL